MLWAISTELSGSFQLGHFFAEMDRRWAKASREQDPRCFNWATSSQKWIGLKMENIENVNEAFQLGHFFAEMDRATIFRPLLISEKTRFTSIALTIQSFFEI